MKSIILSVIVLIACQKNEIKPVYSETKAQRQLVIMLGQSNCGIYTAIDLDSIYADSVKGWNVNTKKLDSRVSNAMTLNHLMGPLVYIAKGLRKSYPKDDLYFLQYHSGGTSLAIDWNPDKLNNLFYKACVEVDNLLITNSFDKVTLIYMQGEADAANLTYAQSYFDNQHHLFDSLTNRYKIDRIFNYQIWSTSAGSEYVTRAKQKESQINKKVILIEIDPQYYIPGGHLSKEGIKVFADSVVSKIGSHRM